MKLKLYFLSFSCESPNIAVNTGSDNYLFHLNAFPKDCMTLYSNNFVFDSCVAVVLWNNSIFTTLNEEFLKQRN